MFSFCASFRGQDRYLCVICFLCSTWHVVARVELGQLKETWL